ncbi:hypothetical protein [Cytobacillus firmus]|uniref:Uncharacterized protein n=1 Tax=Cytobacillus firmus DS1 TaxID=1307436 RepID=W7L0W9_CYTFI|nr:hypothetical protein [Cytobacillus firmus]EWG08727.1 hypothetical protein PBF_22854 [Cytobacillus firmus DS1]
MNLEKVWNELASNGEPGIYSESTMNVFNTLIFSPGNTFGEIKEFIEKTDRRTLEMALGDIYFIPSMEEGDYEEHEIQERYHLYANDFREICYIGEIISTIWRESKPKRKRFF